MSEAKFMADYGPALLKELIEHRDRLLAQLAHPSALVNLEEKIYDPIIARLGAVQGCITAAREAIDTAQKQAFSPIIGLKDK